MLMGVAKLHAYLCSASMLAAMVRAEDCQKVVLDFVVLAGDASHLAIEDDIRADLAVVGYEVVARYLEKEEYNAALAAGDYDMAFSETYGAPYDPNSFLTSWTSDAESHYTLLTKLELPMDLDSWQATLDDVLGEMDAETRQDKWTAIMSKIHDDVLHLPLWGKRIPSVTWKSRLSGYSPGPQQFDYPMHDVFVIDGPKTVSVAPGAQSGLFSSVGRLDPHSYRPNEFFSNNWIYEGLVTYGPNGAIEPSLATSWTTEVKEDGGEIVTFALRKNVLFHDGAEFNCAAVKLNFDHVFPPLFRTPAMHGWYAMPGALEDWHCEDEYTFVLETNKAYYPLLQELTFIRPLRMLSPTAFAFGLNTSPETHNSCPEVWGTISGDDYGLPSITCVGASAISGTGPFKFFSRETNDDKDDEVVFQQNTDYWGGTPDIEFLRVVRYDTSADVYTALLAGEIDAVIGAGVLEPSDLQSLQYDERFDSRHTEPLQNSVVILNIADINVRKVIVHAVNKGPIIDRELGGIEQPVSQLFPKSAPYCDLDLTPKFDYDLDKAKLLNCPEPSSSKKSKKTSTNPLFPVLFTVAAVVAIAGILTICYMARRERAGEPVFSKIKNPMVNDEHVELPVNEKDIESKEN